MGPSHASSPKARCRTGRYVAPAYRPHGGIVLTSFDPGDAGWSRRSPSGHIPHARPSSHRPGQVPLDGYQAYAQICGWTLARAHARTGDRKAISGYLGSSDSMAKAMAQFAESYADQNEADYQRVRRAADDGLVQVASG